MIDWIGGGWMHGEVSGPSTYFTDLTIEVPRGEVVAAAAVSGFSVGVQEHEPGSVAAYVREYAQFDTAGNPHVVDVPPNPENNVLSIKDCFFVRFRLTVFQGKAFAQGLVFRFAPPPPPPPPPPKKPPSPVERKKNFKIQDFRVHVGGKEIGKHRFMTLASGSGLDAKAIEEILKRSTGEAARFLRVRPRDVKTMRAQPRRPPKGGGVF
jgi:hypothetical protein